MATKTPDDAIDAGDQYDLYRLRWRITSITIDERDVWVEGEYKLVRVDDDVDPDIHETELTLAESESTGC